MTMDDIEASGTLPGVPDAFQRLWTPHRMVYVEGEGKPTGGHDCPFCTSPKRTDDDGLVVARGEHAYVVMNLFPYSPGHLLVCPYRHVADYTDLTPEETREVSELTQQAMRVVRSVSKPHGFNIGMNQGDVAGAGIAMHLHQHIVPRWKGDMNFMPVIAQTKAVPQLLGDARRLLAEAWHR
ncbi:HIT family protein [Tessaracoccus sp. Y36]